jgi:hypothetical protein
VEVRVQAVAEAKFLVSLSTSLWPSSSPSTEDCLQSGAEDV